MIHRVFYGAFVTCFLTVMHTVADGNIRSISIENIPPVTSSSGTQKTTNATSQEGSDSVVLKVETKSGNKYQIQGVGKLGKDIWTSLGETFNGDSTVQTIALLQNDAFRFFRVVIMKKSESLDEPAIPVGAPPAIPAAPPAF